MFPLYKSQSHKKTGAFYTFENHLSQGQQEIVIKLVVNLLKETHKTNFGYFFQKLLEERNLTYSELAKYICSYLDFNPEYFSNIYSIDDIKSSLQKMAKAKKIKGNRFENLIYDYFSIDKNLILYGIGKRFKVNWENVDKVFKEYNKTKINDILNKVENPPSDLLPGKELEKNRYCYKKFIHYSPKLYTKLLNSELKQEFEFLTAEEDCLWDLEYLKIMIHTLSRKEQYAIFDLIEQLTSL